jgi:thiamine kinase-like enzyme
MVTGHWSADAARFDAYLTRRRAAWHRVRTTHADLLGSDLRRFYDRLLAALPRHWQADLQPRMAARADLTLLHGDAYACNFLVPRTTPGETYLLDWQSPTFDIGARDLANLCATFWTRAQRREQDREQRVLDNYHEQLANRGVAGYSMANLLDDYRRALVAWVFVPVQDAADGSALSYWRPKMDCLVAAYQDWGCDQLLGAPD